MLPDGFFKSSAARQALKELDAADNEKNMSAMEMAENLDRARNKRKPAVKTADQVLYGKTK
jgi:predicted Zn-dependent protease